MKRGAGKRRVDGKSLRLADEVRYIQRRAAGHDGRVVTIGQLFLFSTETGDAWLLDPADQLAALPGVFSLLEQWIFFFFVEWAGCERNHPTRTPGRRHLRLEAIGSDTQADSWHGRPPTACCLAPKI